MTFRLGGILFLLMATWTLPVPASAPEGSIRPVPRTISTIDSQVVNRLIAPSATAPAKSIRPLTRSSAVKTSEQRASTTAQKSTEGKNTRPQKRGWSLFGKKKNKAALCGIRGIEGHYVDPVRSRVRGCGISDPVTITAVDGVRLSQPATVDCSTAKALFSWVNKVVHPVVKRKGGGVKSLRVAAHYACRTRNNKKGARISEHGKGRAIDISGLRLQNGETLTVLKDWNSRNRRIMRKLHKGACGPFGTVLGPKSDRYHRDHFHFDTASYRSGPYCR